MAHVMLRQAATPGVSSSTAVTVDKLTKRFVAPGGETVFTVTPFGASS